jgi:hypothetical protein
VLFGVVDDDGVVISTYLEDISTRQLQLRAENREAVLQAGLKRIRPAMMTPRHHLRSRCPSSEHGRGLRRDQPMAIPPSAAWRQACHHLSSSPRVCLRRRGVESGTAQRLAVKGATGHELTIRATKEVCADCRGRRNRTTYKTPRPSLVASGLSKVDVVLIFFFFFIFYFFIFYLFLLYYYFFFFYFFFFLYFYFFIIFFFFFVFFLFFIFFLFLLFFFFILIFYFFLLIIFIVFFIFFF